MYTSLGNRQQKTLNMRRQRRGLDKSMLTVVIRHNICDILIALPHAKPCRMCCVNIIRRH